MKNPFAGVNVMAVLVLLTVAGMAFTDRISADAFLTFISGLAIPLRQDGYQSVGTGTREKPLVVEGVPGGEPVPTTDGSQAPLLDGP